MSDSEDPGAVQWDEAERWLAKADQDVAVVKLLEGRHLDAPAGFHCQQAAEKLLKAVLIISGRMPPRIHDLQRLAELSRDAVPQLSAEIELVVTTTFTVWGTADRYPGADPDTEPTAAMLLASIRAIAVLRRAIDLLRPGRPA